MGPSSSFAKYQASTSTSTPSTEITEWAFFIGDTTSNTSNHFYYDIRDQEPGGTAFSYSRHILKGQNIILWTFTWCLSTYKTIYEMVT